MLSPRLLVAAAALAGCAAPGALDAPADHPARLDAPAAAFVVRADALPPVARPRVPAVLVPDGLPPAGGTAVPMSHGMDHEAMTPDTRLGAVSSAPADHAAMGPGSMDAAPAATPLASALDAYLVLHRRLVEGRLDPAAARAFAQAFDALADAPLPGDAHFWHQRPEPVVAVRQAAARLAEAGDLDAARAAFGALSAPFVALVEEVGLPEGYDLVRHTCGMADAADGGVWLQPAGPVANPFFGDAMLACGRPDAPAPSGHEGHEGHEGHGGHETHGTMDAGLRKP